MNADTCEGEYFSPSTCTHASPLPPSTTLNGRCFISFLICGSLIERPIKRFTANNVFSGLVTAWRFAAWPTKRSSSLNATSDGVVRAPSAFSTTFGCEPSMMATQEFVVPKSIPMTLAIIFFLLWRCKGQAHQAPDHDPISAAANTRWII